MIHKIIHEINTFRASHTCEPKGVYLGGIEYGNLMNDPETVKYIELQNYDQNVTIDGVQVYQVNAFHHYNVG